MADIELGSGTGRHTVHRARELRTPWRHRSQEAGWDRSEDWWTPAVDALCEAHVVGDDLTGPCERLGEARARSGVGIGRTLADLDAFTRVIGLWRPPLPMIIALAEGWERGGRSRADCQDPLTGLADRAYLRTRVGELYRGAEDGVPPALGHRLVVLALDPSLDPWRRAARLIVLGHELRRFFTRGESVCLVNRSRIAVIAPDGPELPGELDDLREQTGWEHGAAVWSVPLPGTHPEAVSLLDALDGGGDRSGT
ncbi:hypothetical protein [Nocardiopsis sp. MG754419]|uniref:hypothetical protein n=1 Tax=Nocardiopsis sp. MG754419 TaxID=2259865 RepID=UPI001BA91EA5|nr:hypothetical protein [Nocardiopsis sp. MG754419]MBR8745427.1 hypothetical protein [Nocardiopsis sp. MG754419]